MFHSEGSEALKEPIQFEMKNTFSHWNKAFEHLTFFPSFFCQTNIFSTQKGMLRRAYCLLGEGGKDLTIWPSRRAGVERCGFLPWGSHRRPLASPPWRSALGSPPARGAQGGSSHSPPAAWGWHAACQSVPGRHGYRNSSIAFSWLSAAQPQLTHLNNLTDTRPEPHLAYTHAILNRQLMRLVFGPWFWEETVLISGKFVKKLKTRIKGLNPQRLGRRLQKKRVGKASEEMWPRYP